MSVSHFIQGSVSRTCQWIYRKRGPVYKGKDTECLPSVLRYVTRKRLLLHDESIMKLLLSIYISMPFVACISACLCLCLCCHIVFPIQLSVCLTFSLCLFLFLSLSVWCDIELELIKCNVCYKYRCNTRKWIDEYVRFKRFVKICWMSYVVQY